MQVGPGESDAGPAGTRPVPPAGAEQPTGAAPTIEPGAPPPPGPARPPGSAPAAGAAGMPPPGPLRPPPGAVSPAEPRLNPWSVVAAVFVGGWAVAVTVGAQALGWLVAQVQLATGLDQAAWLRAVPGLADGMLVAVPAALLAALPRSPAVRAAGRAWLLGAAALAVLGPLRAIPMPHNEAYLVALALVATLGTVLLRRAGGGPDRPRSEPVAIGFAVAGGLAALLPWLLLGALGGLLETALAVVAAATVARLAAAVLDHRFWAPYGADRRPGSRSRPVRLVLVGGLVAAVSLLLVAAGTGQDGAQLAAMLVLPPLGFAAAALQRPSGPARGAAPASRAREDPLAPAGDPGRPPAGDPGRPPATHRCLPPAGDPGRPPAAHRGLPPAGDPGRPPAAHRGLPPAGDPGRPPAAHRGLPPGGRIVAGPATLAWLVGVAAVGPLAFADPEEISLLLAGRADVPFWVAVAAAGSLAVAVLLGIAYGLVFARPARAATTGRGSWRLERVAAVAVTVALLTAGGVYAGFGQPGLYGERLFVVLKEQADLGEVAGGPAGPAGRAARGAEVYRRLVATAQRSQAGLRRDLARRHLGYRPYYLVNGVEVDGGPAVRAWLSRRGEVARVLIGQRLRPVPATPGPPGATATAPIAAPDNIAMIRADRVRSELGVDGSGIVVGGSDSGVDGAHPELSAGFRGGDDSWYDPWNGSRTPEDRGGHGTHTLATAVGRTVGVAPGARWVGCVNLDRNLGNPARYLDCLQFMLAPFPVGGDPFTDGRPARAPQVLTNSWGCPPIEGCDADALRPATAALAAAGVFAVVAAGNTGPFCGSVDDPPASYSDVFTVGAVDRQRRVAPFSGRGPAPGGLAKPDIVAPGTRVLSAVPGGYARFDGTSMATPHVAGVVALMWSANPALVGDIARTRQILRDTAVTAIPSASIPRDVDCPQVADVTGAGLVDALAAVRAVQRER